MKSSIFGLGFLRGQIAGFAKSRLGRGLLRGVLASSVFCLALCFAVVAIGCSNAGSGADLDIDLAFSKAQERGFDGSVQELESALSEGRSYLFATQNGYQGSDSEWLLLLFFSRSNQEILPQIGANGHWFVGSVDTSVAAKEQAADELPYIRSSGNWFVGEQDTGIYAFSASSVIVPHIGANGNWFLGKVDTGVSAKGNDGLSAYEIYLKYHPEYEGDEQQWINDLANGNLVRYTASFNSLGGSQVAAITNIQKNTAIEAPTAPSRPDHDFAGWFKDIELTQQWDFAIDTVSSDLTLFAKWTYNRTFGLKFELAADGAHYILKGRGISKDSHINIPAYYQNLPVTTIGSGAFINGTITEVTIPNTVTEIASSAFMYCTELTAVNFEANSQLAYIRKEAFVHCYALEEMIFPDSLTTIESFAFNYCEQLSVISFGAQSKLSNIALHAFKDTSIVSVALPKSITYIGDSAFANKTLTSISLSSDNQYYSVQKNVLYNKHLTSILCYPGGLIDTTFTIPSTVYNINEAFRAGSSPKKLIIPKSVTYIADLSFQGNDGLEEVIFNDDCTIQQLVKRVFETAWSLKSITLPDSLITIGNDAFSRCYQLTTVNLSQTSKLKTIGSGAFSQTNLTNFDIPRSVTSIGDYAFSSTALTDIVVPDSVNVLGSGVFEDCSALIDARLPASLESIAQYMFMDCVSLENITIPATVTSINGSAFYNCYKLYVHIEAVVPAQVDSTAFAGVAAVFVKEQLLDDYRAAWSDLQPILYTYSSIVYDDYLVRDGVLKSYKGKSSVVTLPSNITTIASNAFRDSNVVQLHIPYGVTHIETLAFRNCASLVQITLPSTISSIGTNAFSGCQSLLEILVDQANPSYVSIDGVLLSKNQTILLTFPNGRTGAYTVPPTVTQIAQYAFSSAQIESVSLPSGLTNIEHSAFYGTESLLSVEIPPLVTTIGERTFGGCSALQSVTLNNVVAIGQSAFAGCTNLRGITFPSTLTTIEAGAFYNTGLVSVTLSNTITSLGTRAFEYNQNLVSVKFEDGFVVDRLLGTFRNCPSLTSVDFGQGFVANEMFATFQGSGLTSVLIPSGIKIINAAFANCESLILATFEQESQLESINNVFYGCISLTQANLPDSLTFLSNSAFSRCTSLASLTIPASVTTIANSALYYCTSLVTLTILSDQPVTLTADVLYDCTSLTKIYVNNQALLQAYQTAPFWENYADLFAIAEQPTLDQ